MWDWDTVSFLSVRIRRCLQAPTLCLSMYLSVSAYASSNEQCGNLPLAMTFPSAHHSPKTVNKNASELVIGTVRLNYAFPTYEFVNT